MNAVKQSTSKSAKKSYGPESFEHQPDISLEQLKIKNYLTQHIELTHEQI